MNGLDGFDLHANTAVPGGDQRRLRAGLRINQIGRLIERGARTRSYGVIRNLASHGTGGALHEYPQDILNYYDSNDRRVLTGGLVLTIEPFLSTGQQNVVTDADGWTLRTPAGSFAAQHEHTLVVTDGAPLLLTHLWVFMGEYMSGMPSQGFCGRSSVIVNHGAFDATS